jgi:hypothetical protein
VIPRREALAKHEPRYPSGGPQLEYAWLCSSCSSDLTIQSDNDFGMRVVRKGEAKNGPTFSASGSDANNMGIR